jgi:pimeloyl-ACP methyl ester carboxylesterase
METRTLNTTDGKQIAWDISGQGPVLMLLHGAGKERQDWHTLGYVERLQPDFTVITVDIRGSGESEKCLEVEDYAIERICTDLLQVADACGVEKFALWGFSFGGNIARYLAAESDRVTALAMIGIPFGPATSDAFDGYIAAYEKKWGEQLARYHAGTLSEKERKALLKNKSVIWLPCFKAMRRWPDLEPEAVHCPTLMATGTRNDFDCKWIAAHREEVERLGIQVEYFEGLTHMEEFTEVEKVFPQIRGFFKKVINRG